MGVSKCVCVVKQTIIFVKNLCVDVLTYRLEYMCTYLCYFVYAFICEHVFIMYVYSFVYLNAMYFIQLCKCKKWVMSI